MPKYIDADRFERVLMGLGEDVICDDCCLEVLNRLDDAPAADVAPVKHGKWIETDDRPNVESNRVYRCSVCNFADEHSPSADVPFCWHCGARMQKEEDDA